MSYFSKKIILLFVKKQTTKILATIFKIAIAVFAFAFIFLQIKEYNNKNISFLPKNISDLFYLIVVFFFMFINWAVEALKWQYLINDFEKISFKTSLKAVFSGISFAIFTPNRVGEIAGRSFVLKKENRGKGIVATSVGSMSQMIITVILGVIFGALFLFFYDDKISNISFETLLFVKVISVIILILVLYFFFNLNVFTKFLLKLNFLNKYLETIMVLSSYRKVKLFNVLLFSLLRYIVFLSQFYLLLKMFSVNISFFEASIGIVLTYFISSAIPTFTFAEIGIRGSAAIFFLGMFSNNIEGIISATALLWIINLAIPAIIGSVIFSKIKI